MEPRRWRPKFYNPFTERKQHAGYPPLYGGFFRIMPLHRWSNSDTQKVLGYAAVNPSLFGFPDQPTCIVNPASFLPSMRGRLRGVMAFGADRGCKNIVIPGGCHQADYVDVDAKLLEPLFRFNPGVEYVYLAKECEPLTPQLVSLLSRCNQLHTITLEGWNDAVAIHRIVMACKQVDVVDTFSLDDPPREWKNEVSVQALCTLTEMHPKLRVVKSDRSYLTDWSGATQFSRCKHNVALLVYTCNYVALFSLLFWGLLAIPAFLTYLVMRKLTKGHFSPDYEFFWSVMAALGMFTTLMVVDWLGWKTRGRGWVHLQKYFILAKRRADLFMLHRQTRAVVNT